jgi:hypothetical protein
LRYGIGKTAEGLLLVGAQTLPNRCLVATSRSNALASGAIRPTAEREFEYAKSSAFLFEAAPSTPFEEIVEGRPGRKPVFTAQCY